MSVTHPYIVFAGMQILHERQWLSHYVVVTQGECIQAIIPREQAGQYQEAKWYEFPADYYLIPGMIDLHIHGANNKDVMDGQDDALSTISAALVQEGVTGFLATTMTASDAQISRVLQGMADQSTHLHGAAMLGIHLEGPFIAESKVGAQSRKNCQLPNIHLMQEWQKISNQRIKLVTMAPELPGAIPFIQVLASLNIIPAIGHSNATFAQAEEAIAAGCRYATHLFNAMRTIHQREPGVVLAVLLNNDVLAELIVDGHHLHPAMLELALRMKGPERLLLVTDAMRAKCLNDGVYELGGQQVKVYQGKATLAEDCLAGSTLRMPQAISTMIHSSTASLIDAIYMASLNPARLLSLDNKKGSIEVGKDADLVVLDAKLHVQLTMRAGKCVFSK